MNRWFLFTNWVGKTVFFCLDVVIPGLFFVCSSLIFLFFVSFARAYVRTGCKLSDFPNVCRYNIDQDIQRCLSRCSFSDISFKRFLFGVANDMMPTQSYEKVWDTIRIDQRSVFFAVINHLGNWTQKLILTVFCLSFNSMLNVLNLYLKRIFLD